MEKMKKPDSWQSEVLHNVLEDDYKSGRVLDFSTLQPAQTDTKSTEV